MNILIVDDLEENLYFLEKVLSSKEYKTKTAKNGFEALKELKKDLFDLIISDILMPKMDGFQFCRECKKDEKLRNIPFLFYTATYTEKKDEEFALSLGAEKFIIKPQDPDTILKILNDIFKKHREKTNVVSKEKTDDEVTYLTEYSKRIVKKLEKKVADLNREITIRKLAEEEQKESYFKLEETLNNTIKTLALVVEIKDPYTSGHQAKVAKLSVAIAKELKLSELKIDEINKAAAIHDIGKIMVPQSILSKPSVLSDLEFSLIKTHCQTGYDILENIDFGFPIADIVMQHHERENGLGYPKGLLGSDIMLEAKIISVADVIEAMSSHRPYRAALGLDKALEEIRKNKGILYDPIVVDSCLHVFNKGKFKF